VAQRGVTSLTAQLPLRPTFFTPSAKILSTSSLCFEKLSTRLSLALLAFHIHVNHISVHIPHLRIVLVLLLALPRPVGDGKHPRALHHERNRAL